MEKPQIFIVDASVALKWYVKEKMREKALKLRDDFVSGLIELEAPSLILSELGNAMRHHPASTASDRSEAVKQLRNLGLVIHELYDTLVDTTANFALREKSTFHDVSSVGLASAK